MDESKLLLMKTRMELSYYMLRIIALIGVGTLLGILIAFPVGYLWVNIGWIFFILKLGFMESIIISLFISILCGVLVLNLIRDRIGGQAGVIINIVAITCMATIGCLEVGHVKYCDTYYKYRRA